MELTKQERELEKSTAEAHGSLSLGLFATACLVSSVSDGLWWIPFVVLGILSMLSSFNLAFVHRWKRKRFLEIAANVRIKHVAWFLGLAGLGICLVKTGDTVLGTIFIGLGYTIFIVGTWKTGGQERGTRETTEEAKVENNTQQQEGCSNEDIYSKLARIERKIDFSSLTQRNIAFYALGTAFVILGVSLWPGFLEWIGIGKGSFYINSIAFWVLGVIPIIYAAVSQRAGKKKLEEKEMGSKGRKNIKKPKQKKKKNERES